MPVSTGPSGPSDPRSPDRVPWRHIALFCAIAYGLGWLVMIPAWTGDGTDDPAYPLLLGAFQCAPSLAVLLMVFVVHRRGNGPGGVARGTGLLPLRPVGRTLAWAGLALAGSVLVGLAAIPIAAGAGWYPLDLAHVSGLRAAMAAAGTPADAIPSGALMAISVVNGLIFTLLALPTCFGEEWGWRGYLLPRLLPLGVRPALLVSGMIWGLWHAPIILIGHLYQRPDAVGLAAMVVFCVLAGTLIGWLRLASGSVWPAVVAHASVNGVAGYVNAMVADKSGLDPMWGAITGLPGWLLMTAVIIGLALLGRLGPGLARTGGDRADAPANV